MDEPTREQLESWDREIVWHPFTQMAEYEPLILERGEGCTVIDVDGNRYLDGTSSLWCNVHGHRHPRLDAAAKEQLDLVAHVTALGCSNPAKFDWRSDWSTWRRKTSRTSSSRMTVQRPSKSR